VTFEHCLVCAAQGDCVAQHLNAQAAGAQSAVQAFSDFRPVVVTIHSASSVVTRSTAYTVMKLTSGPAICAGTGPHDLDTSRASTSKALRDWRYSAGDTSTGGAST
jgi:hypothetical protein